MKCPKCGMVVPDKERFCEFCATDLHPERARRADNPYLQYKRREAAKKGEEDRHRAAEAMALRRSRTKPVKSPDRPAAERTRRRAGTRALSSRSIGTAIAEATSVGGFLPRSLLKLAAVVLCGIVVVSLAFLCTWEYAVGYPSPHQLVLDFDKAIRSGEYARAKALASGELPAELMEVVSRASLSETYPRHLERPDESTRRIKCDEFIIDLRRSMGKWSLTLRKKSGRDRFGT